MVRAASKEYANEEGISVDALAWVERGADGQAYLCFDRILEGYGHLVLSIAAAGAGGLEEIGATLQNGKTGRGEAVPCEVRFWPYDLGAGWSWPAPEDCEW